MSGTGWPEAPAGEQAPADGTGGAPVPDQPAAETLARPVSRSSGRQPGSRRDPSAAGAWGAATDSIGSSGPRAAPDQAPAASEPDGTPVGRAEPGDAAASRAPARRWDSGPAGDRPRPVSSRPPARRPEARRPGVPGSELLGDLQRWLIRSGTRSMRRELEGQVRRTLGGSRRPENTDTWGTATTEPPPHLGESPECAWCPICRAARRMRESGPDLGSQLSGASDAVASAVQDAIVAVDAIFSRTGAAPGQRRPADRSSATSHADSATDPAERVPDEPGDRG